jgi:hypothetical protein
MKQGMTLVIAVLIAAIVALPALANPTPLGQKADGLRLQAMAERYGELQGLKADGLRWQAMARAYTARSFTPAASNGGSFDWADAGIGVAGGLVIAVFTAGGIAFVRHSRRTKLAL